MIVALNLKIFSTGSLSPNFIKTYKTLLFLQLYNAQNEIKSLPTKRRLYDLRNQVPSKGAQTRLLNRDG